MVQRKSKSQSWVDRALEIREEGMIVKLSADRSGKSAVTKNEVFLRRIEGLKLSQECG
jgi:hypothetical protein